MLIVFTILIIIAATAEGVSYTGHKSHISASARIRSGRAWDGRREEGNNERYNSRSSCVVILANCYDPNHVGRGERGEEEGVDGWRYGGLWKREEKEKKKKGLYWGRAREVSRCRVLHHSLAG